MKKGIELNVNNGDTLFLTQTSADGDTILNRYDGDKMEYCCTIPAGDMVMLLNLYRYIKGNDIQNDFINPAGRNAEETPENHFKQNKVSMDIEYYGRRPDFTEIWSEHYIINFTGSTPADCMKQYNAWKHNHDCAKYTIPRIIAIY